MNKLKTIILNLASKKERIKTVDVLTEIDNSVSRAYASRMIKELVEDGKLIKGGSTAGAFYVLPERKELIKSEIVYNKRFKRDGLEEHLVLNEINRTNIYAGLKNNAQSIFDYAFSEMINNAIDHSMSKNVKVEVLKYNKKLKFIVTDFGVGVFRNIKNKKKLNSELEAVQDLLKGKTTTAPKLHSGEGIFFTSKIADYFSLDSYGFQLIIDNEIEDIFFGESKKKNVGTKVVFIISTDTKKHLVDLFRNFQLDQEEMAFDKTSIKIKLFTVGTVHVSRSQARRVLSGLNKFKKIILDFNEVPMIGQGFADEIFRVYKIKHPEIDIEPINTNQAVEFMIKRVEKTEVLKNDTLN